MISSILVATDGSKTADRAVGLAAELAAKLSVPLTVGHVLQHSAQVEELSRMAEVEHLVHHVKSQKPFHLGDIPSNMDALFSNDLTGAERERVIAVIGDEIAARAASHAKELGAKTVLTRVVNGNYDDGILGMAKEVGADMIVIGHRGLGPIKRIFQGSVSQKVNQQADCTVVTVH